MNEPQALDRVVELLIKSLPKPILTKLASEAEEVAIKKELRPIKRQIASRLSPGTDTISQRHYDAYTKKPNIFDRIREYLYEKYGHLLPQEYGTATSK